MTEPTKTDEQEARDRFVHGGVLPGGTLLQRIKGSLLCKSGHAPKVTQILIWTGVRCARCGQHLAEYRP